MRSMIESDVVSFIGVTTRIIVPVVAKGVLCVIDPDCNGTCVVVEVSVSVDTVESKILFEIDMFMFLFMFFSASSF